MADSVGDIAVRLSADIAPFQRGMDQAGRSVRGFDRQTLQMSRNVARAGAVAATAILGIGAAGVALAQQAGQAAVEIENLSRISQTSTTEFQRQAAAAETVGINAEKLADIFRDVTDRVGDFIATGAGPMADFFENIAPQVGVTVEQFARLSGPEALQLYVSSLEAANVTQAEMTFYLEAMASDASNLTPLLRDNGRAMQELGDQAQRTGRIMSSEAIENGRELNDVLLRVSGTIRTTMNAALLENSDEILRAADSIEARLIPALNSVVPVVATVVSEISAMVGTIASVATAIDDLISRIPGGWDTLTDGLNPFSGVSDVRQGFADFMDRRSRNIAADNDPTNNPHGPVYLPPTANPHGPAYTVPAFEIPGVTTPSDEGGGGGGGGGARDWGGDFEAMQERFMTEQELIQENYERQLEMLAEFRASRAGSEEEYNELERRIHADHAEQMRQQEQEALRMRLNMVGDAMGNVATMLQAGGERNLGIVRGFRIAEASLAGAQAAVSAWNAGMSTPGGGPVLAAAYTAASLARTGAMISQMKSGSTSGGGGGGGSVATAAVARPTQNIMLDLRGASPSQANSAQAWADAANEAIRDGLAPNFMVRSR